MWSSSGCAMAASLAFWRVCGRIGRPSMDPRVPGSGSGLMATVLRKLKMAIEPIETVVALCRYGTTKSCDISPCFQRGALAFLRIDFFILVISMDTLPYFRHLFNLLQTFLLYQRITLRNVLQSRSTRKESRAQKYCTLAEGDAPHVRDEGHFCTIFILFDDLAPSNYLFFIFTYFFSLLILENRIIV